jgi:DMSO/TMAO reductase YedYZ heme-binding membrane subunit
MSSNLSSLLNSKFINSWNLFLLITAPISTVMVLSMLRTELTSGPAVSTMIELSVRCAVPLLFVAFAASSVNVLFPGVFGRWLLRNRKFIGLSFAATMAWQLLFIIWMVGFYTDHYVEKVYALSDVIEGVGGYLLLIAMVLTSFKFGRRRLSSKQWKYLHKGGIYWLWIYVWIAYWFHMFYYGNKPLAIDYVFYWAGFLAWGLRMAAWTKRRWPQASGLSKSEGTSQLLYLLPGVALVATGLVGVSFGSPWGRQVYEFFSSIPVWNTIGIYTPFFPFAPLFTLFLMMFGAFLILRSRGQSGYG